MHRRNFIINTSILAAAGIAGQGGVVLANQGTKSRSAGFTESFVKIGRKTPFYFELTNGDPYIPIGANLCWARDMATLETYFKKLSENEGNYARVWLNFPRHEIELEYGKVDTTNLGNIESIVDMAMKYRLKVKFCIESFRRITPKKDFFTKTQYHKDNGGPFADMNDYINSEKGRQVYLKRLGVFQQKFGDHPAIFGWELWNEMNAIDSEGLWDWNEYMLTKVHAMFPKNLVLQSLGSFDNESARNDYRFINRLPQNDVAQIHRYLDMGASLDICKAPMDMLASNAIDELRSYQVQKPMLLAEVGGVRPKHTGPIDEYGLDKEGILLHDLLFAPFFSGAAGPGHAWHWDSYIDKNNLWHHFQKFSQCVKGINPLNEQFVAIKLFGPRIRAYILAGCNTVMVWCRDSENDWKSELVQGNPPRDVAGYMLNLSTIVHRSDIKNAELFDPWENQWAKLPSKSIIELPSFRRSVVVRIHKKT